MKTLILLVSTIGFMGFAQAAPAKSGNIPAAKPAKATTTEHNFEDLLVQGKYHFSDESVTTVEEDKVLDSLIGVRSDFKDRLKQSSGRY